MSVSAAIEPQIIHAIPGRLRLHVPAWSGPGQRWIEASLRALPGVSRVQANQLTRNVLVLFDPHKTSERSILHVVRSLDLSEQDSGEAPSEVAAPPVHQERHGHLQRARIAVRGLDRSPSLARLVEERLGRLESVRAQASPLTGRVLVEYDEHRVSIEELTSEIVDIELPPLLDEARPAHPLDPAPLINSASRGTGAALGLSLLIGRQLTGRTGPPTQSPVPAIIANVVGILRGFPTIRYGLRRLLGPNVADLAFSAAGVVSLTFSGSPLGLLLNGVEALRVLTEVIPQRAAFRAYEADLLDEASPAPGRVVRLEAGDRVPAAGEILEGTGIAVGLDGGPRSVGPYDSIGAGSVVHGGPFVLEILDRPGFEPEPRPSPPRPTIFDRYLRFIGPISLTVAAFTGIATRSVERAFEAMAIVNPRSALIGAESADISASARAVRAGGTVVGTRPERAIRRPDLLLIDGTRSLTDGTEVSTVIPLIDNLDVADVLNLSGAVARAANSPWGTSFPLRPTLEASNGRFDHRGASADVAGRRYQLSEVDSPETMSGVAHLRERGDYVLQLRRDSDARSLAVISLRPRLTPDITKLVATCKNHHVELMLLQRGESTVARGIARRAQIPLADADAVTVIRARQQRGDLVAYASDTPSSGPAFAACDLAIGVTNGQTAFPARADLLTPNLTGVADIIEAGVRRDLAVRDSVVLSLISNVFGLGWGVRRAAPAERNAGNGIYLTALAALGDGWLRLQDGARVSPSRGRLRDPRPERWGRERVDDVMKTFETTPEGLTNDEAMRRRRIVEPTSSRSELLHAVLEQVQSPLVGIMAAGAALSLIIGSSLDVLIIGATIATNVAIGAWQERRADRAAATLAEMSRPTARVRRGGDIVTVPGTSVVPGDILVFASGDRIAADCRLIQSQNLEISEAALTGESFPVAKQANGSSDSSQIVLEGSDVIVGSGEAVVVATGRDTRLGAMAAALNIEQEVRNPLADRLSQMLRISLPVAAASAGLVIVSGLLRRQPLLAQLALGSSVAIAAVPEGLPLLAKMGEAAVGQRLSGRGAVVRRLTSVEALGRVNVVCADKTGTLTTGRLELTLVADLDSEAALPGQLPSRFHTIVRDAAIASPHPDASEASAHLTDVAVVEAAEAAGMSDAIRVQRDAEHPFGSDQAFHAVASRGRLYVKGAPEIVAPRCSRIRHGDETVDLDEDAAQRLLLRAEELAARGLRVLIVAEGSSGSPIDDPTDLTAVGFVGISDPLRPGVAEAVRRCRQSGVRVVMLTGDHAATAQTIAREAGLDSDDSAILTGAEVVTLDNGVLDERLMKTSVVARATPLDKLRIVESLRRLGYTVAMTGDGINDAPALRLADAGVAMGHGTEVAQQAADVVLLKDDFVTLVETFVEGRGFWENIRRAVSLLLGGNLGELGLIAGLSILGFGRPLNTRQILAVNMITDVLPALAIALQPPSHRNLARLAREGTEALDSPLRRDILRRGLSTALPAIAAYVAASGFGAAAEASTIGFASIVGTQLGQTLAIGQSQGGLSRSVVAAVGASAGLLGAAMTVTPLRVFLGLAPLSAQGLLLLAAATAGAVALSGLLDIPWGGRSHSPDSPAPVVPRPARA